MNYSSHPCSKSILAITLLIFLCSFNSQEHKIISDLAFQKVVDWNSIPELTKNILAIDHACAGTYKNHWPAAKDLAAVQDNCYYHGYGQQSFNARNHIWPEPDFPKSCLLIPTTVGSAEVHLSFGDLVALYGDYRRTIYCSDKQCYITNSNENKVNFVATGANLSMNCGSHATAIDYVKSIALGLVPPYGSAGNTFSNSAGEQEYDNAGWWGDEMIRIANVNETHFASAAISWYVGMHRLALLFVEKAVVQPIYWKHALHYQAAALHALTDLFALGHIVTKRNITSYNAMKEQGLLKAKSYLWMENTLAMGGWRHTSSGDDSVHIQAPWDLPDLKEVDNHRIDFMPSYLPKDWSLRANNEHNYHDDLNNMGAIVRNFAGQRFQIYGDGKLHSLSKGNRNILENTIASSLQSLFDAYELLKNGVKADSISKSTTYFKALKYIPVFIEAHEDQDKKGMWVRYAEYASVLSGVKNLPGDWYHNQIPHIDGFSQVKYTEIIKGKTAFPGSLKSSHTGVGFEVYPNPVTIGEELKIVSKEEIDRVSIVNLSGKNLHTYNHKLFIYLDHYAIPLENDLEPGVYVLQFFNKENKSFAARKISVVD